MAAKTARMAADNFGIPELATPSETFNVFDKKPLGTVASGVPSGCYFRKSSV